MFFKAKIILNARKSIWLSPCKFRQCKINSFTRNFTIFYVYDEKGEYLGDQETISIFRKAGCDKCERERAPDN